MDTLKRLSVVTNNFEELKEKLAKVFLILSAIFFAPDAIFIILKAISAFIYMITIYWR